MKERFRVFTRRVSNGAGSPWAFCAALVSVLIWGAVGPIFHFSTTWQLVANTFTTLATYLMMFLVQSSQNNDTTEIKVMLKQLVEDLSEVDEVRAAARVEAELT